MEIQQAAHSGFLHIRAVGRLDSHAAGSFGAMLSDTVRAGGTNLRLDLLGIEFISSAGLRVLVKAAKEIRMAGGVFWIEPVSEAVRNVLELAGLGSMLARPPAAPKIAEGMFSESSEDTAAHGSGEAGLPESFEFDSGAGFRPMDWRVIEGGRLETLAATADRIAIGIGAFGNTSEEAEKRLGEFLMAGEAVVTLPGAPLAKPDFLVAQGDLVPQIQAKAALWAEGNLSGFFRFDAGGGCISLSTIARRILQTAGTSAAGAVLLADSAGIVGASLRKPPAVERIQFQHPNIREWLTFTPEKAHIRSLVLVVGFAAYAEASLSEKIRAQLRPMDAAGDLLGHFHAVVFPARFLPRGELKLKESVQLLLEGALPEDVLHLIFDGRPDGAGETELHDCAGWCGALSPQI